MSDRRAVLAASVHNTIVGSSSREVRFGPARDPAVEAAERAIGESVDMSSAIGSAREALRPIRDLHKPINYAGERWLECESCLTTDWPCPTAELIYTSEELAAMEGCD